MKYVKFITKADQWFKEGTEAFVEDKNFNAVRLTLEDYNKKIKEWDSNVFVGIHINNEGKSVIDGELCFDEEFNIIEIDDEPINMNLQELEEFYKIKSNF